MYNSGNILALYHLFCFALPVLQLLGSREKDLKPQKYNVNQCNIVNENQSLCHNRVFQFKNVTVVNVKAVKMAKVVWVVKWFV